MPGRQEARAILVAIMAVSLGGAGSSESPAPREQSAVEYNPLPQRATPNPIQTVRVFSALQERIINGSSDALQSQAGLAREIGGLLLRFNNETWNDARNRESAIKFALMGGDPRVLEELDRKKVFEGVERNLVRGALGFAYGDRKAAVAELQSVDPRSLAPGLGGHVALIMAVLVGSDDPIKALNFCDEARLLSPGTGVEEAALRLSIELAIAANSPSRFDASVIHHLRRFPNSLYAKTIDARIVGVLAVRDIKSGARNPVLEAIISETLPLERQRQLLEGLIKSALRKGAAPMAAFAARRLRTIAVEDVSVADLCRTAEAAQAIAEGKLGEARRLLSEPANNATIAETRAIIGEMRAMMVAIEAPPTKARPTASDEGAKTIRTVDAAVDGFGRFGELAKKVEMVVGEIDNLLLKAGS